MSHKKWIHKYLYLQEEKSEFELIEKENIQKFNDYFELESTGSSPTTPKEEPSLPKIPNNPGKPIYKKLSKLLHPDKGGDEEEFKLLSIMYQKQDTVGLYLKAEQMGIDMEEYLTEDFTKSFEDSCKILEEDIKNIQGTLSWVWCNSPNDVDRAVQKIYLKKEFNLVPKKDQENK
jgi:hypothetical protein